MTPRERFLAALERRTIKGPVPHYELEFFLTMEAFGRVHPSQREYGQWDQMSEAERRLHLEDIADLWVQTQRRFGLAGTLFQSPRGWHEEDTRRSLDHVRTIDGFDHVVTLHGDATYEIPFGSDMIAFVGRIADDPQGMKDHAQRRVDEALETGRRMKEWGTVDGFALCADYCFNDNPFLGPDLFNTFVTPYLNELVAGYRKMGFYVIKHTDGNIMPILDQLAGANPHAIHSLDPQGGVDIAEVKQLVGDRVCLIGNVNCGLLHSGTEQEVVDNVRYTLKHGMPGGGYVFGTSNCIYTGLPLERYELMLRVWREEGVYE
jgi:uroporphyrinogen decarboxylase